MRNFRVGTVGGIPIRINVTLVLFLPVLAWLIAGGGQITVYVGLIGAVSSQQLSAPTLQAGNTEWVIGFAGAVGLFGSVLLHELGHAWMARRYGVGIVSITLWISGGMARMAEIPDEWHKELWLALAGPAVSIALGVGGVAALWAVPTSLPVLAFVVGFQGVVNLTLVVFNLLPAFPMDGGGCCGRFWPAPGRTPRRPGPPRRSARGWPC
ncbi:MAG: site-2 protease family protein [Halobacteriales archaeon]